MRSSINYYILQYMFMKYNVWDSFLLNYFNIAFSIHPQAYLEPQNL